MKAIIVKEPKCVEIIDMPCPKVKSPEEVLVKIKAAGICGSDIAIYHGTNPMVSYPRIIGHEMTGIVVETGSKVNNVSVGDRVIIDQVVNCGKCYPCSINRLNICNNLKVRGVNIDGGYREYMVVKENSVYRIPDNISYGQAVLIEPLSIAFQVVSRAQVCASDTVLVYGAGMVGLSIIKSLKLTGAKIIATDIIDAKLQMALECGADVVLNSNNKDIIERLKSIANNGEGPSVAIESSGFPGILSLLVKVTCNAGRIITLGFSNSSVDLSEMQITSRELDIRGSRLQNHKMPEVIKAIRDNKIRVDDIISHQMHFTRIQEAFDLIDSKDISVKKVVLLFD